MSKEQIAELISNIELSKLKPFEDHPFSIRDDEAMQQTAESVREYGVLVPAIVRPLEDGTFPVLRALTQSIKSLQSIFRMCIAIVRTFAYNISKETQSGKEWRIHGKISKPVCPHRT